MAPLFSRPFVAVGMLQQQWCHGPHNNTDLAESEGFGGCQGRGQGNGAVLEKHGRDGSEKLFGNEGSLETCHPSLLLGEKIYC